MVPEVERVEEIPHSLDVSPRHEADVNRWRPATRIAFGFFCAYSLLVWVPWTLAFAGVVQLSWFDVLGRWLITHVFHLPEHFVPSLTAANYLPNYLATIILATASAILAAIWTAVDRSKTRPRSFVWLHTLVRFMLAALMLSYGWHKVLPGQFGRLAAGGGTDYLIHQVGQLSPRDLLWAFMEGSRPYQIFAGLTELAGGVFLLSRRTAMLGGAITVAAMTNVLMLDVAYDVGVKFLAGQILLMAIFVLAPYGKRLLSAFVPDQATVPVTLSPVFRHRTADRTARMIGMVFAAAIIVWAFRDAQSTVANNRAISQTPLHGIWDVEEVSRNGVPVPLVITDPTLLRRLVFPWSGITAGAIIVWMSDAVTRCTSTIDLQAKRINLKPLPGDSTVVGSIFGIPQSTAAQSLSFSFSVIDNDRLVLSRTTSGDSLVIRLRKFDPMTYPLIRHKSQWRW